MATAEREAAVLALIRSNIGRAPPLLPSAAQPDIVRAVQKDGMYLQQLVDACHDGVRHLLGPHRALQWARETRLVAELLYHGLTTGAGTQTLGEEYCDILQVTGRVGVAPGRVQRGVLVLLETFPPYLAERLGLPSGVGSDEGAFPQSSPFLEDARQPSGAPPATSGYAEGSTRRQNWRSLAGLVFSRGLARWQQLWRVMKSNSGVAVRLHLALFYFYGVYYHWAKRLTGIRYMFIGRFFERRPSYHVLGILLFMQLAATSGTGLLQRAYQFLTGRAPEPSSPGTGTPGGSGRRPSNQPQHAIVCKPGITGEVATAEEEEEEEADVEAGLGGEVPPQRRCPLCLSAREHPTATPCGHVFCWNCISEWHNQKPECPLCRTGFSTSGLVRAYHADF